MAPTFWYLAACISVGYCATSLEDDAISLLQKAATYQRSNDTDSPLKTRYNNMCMDYNYNNKNVYMHKCHGGTNQKWNMDKERLSTQHDNKCLDLNSDSGNVYMHDCHGGLNQQWFFDGETLRSRHSPSKCLDYNFNSGNIYLSSCHGEDNQNFYWALPPNPALASRVKSRHGGKCLSVNGANRNLYFSTCHDGLHQKFYLDGVELKSLYNINFDNYNQYDNTCADYNYNTMNVYMHGCHNGKNQRWYLDGEQFKTRYDANCLDLHTRSSGSNVYMHGCHGGDNQKFYMENVVEGLDHNEVDDEILAEEEEVRECKEWCYSKKHKDKAWEGTKCAWKSCAGCNEC